MEKLSLKPLILLFILSFFIFINNKNEARVNYSNIESEVVCIEPQIQLPTNFNEVYTSFKSYNPHIDSSSAKTVAEVSNHFGLSKDDRTFKWVLGQLLLESGAKQYYQPGHSRCGELVVSSAGAIGFSQILPSTALGYMQKKITHEEADCFYELGATDFSFAYNDTLSKKRKKEMAKIWLENETNNIIMWGKIMGSTLDNKPLMDALISYNAGSLGLRRFLNLGNKREDHKYITGIQTRLKYVSL
jgi:hypothetical protein